MRRRGYLSSEKARIAQERIDILFDLAEKELKTHPERSRRYVELARIIGMKCNLRLKTGQKRKFCKKCNQLLIPKKTCEIRIDSKKGLMEIRCMNCGGLYRRPYVKI